MEILINLHTEKIYLPGLIAREEIEGIGSERDILHDYILEGIYFDLFNCLYAIVRTATRAYHIVVFALELINL